MDFTSSSKEELFWWHMQAGISLRSPEKGTWTQKSTEPRRDSREHKRIRDGIWMPAIGKWTIRWSDVGIHFRVFQEMLKILTRLQMPRQLVSHEEWGTKEGKYQHAKYKKEKGERQKEPRGGMGTNGWVAFAQFVLRDEFRRIVTVEKHSGKIK